ncbi:MAG: hypothetical protein D6739_04965, partial [Nitrospirae bacterium]
PTDDHPFFHRMSDPIPASAAARLKIEGPQLAETAVLWTALVSTGVALVALLLPLALRRRQALPRPAAGHLAVAALLGVGFMVLELGLAQRLTLLCGRPVVAFAAVVGGMLLGAGGLGLSLRAEGLGLRPALLLSAGGCILAAVLPPALLSSGALALPGVARITLAAAASALVALPLGLPFPALVARTHEAVPGSAPWLYALNAATSVAASALYAALAPTVGLAGTAALAAVAYLLAAAAGSGRRA